MGFLRKKRGQSMTEFALAFPFFLMAMLGIAQLAIIFYNAVMLKYTAYMTARVAVVYNESKRNNKAGAAHFRLKTAMNAANRHEKPGVDYVKNLAENFAAEKVMELAGEGGLKIKKEEMRSSEGDFIKTTVHYALPLKVPVAGKIFGLFSGDKSSFALSAAGYPVYNLKASSIMRLEQEDNDEEDS